MKPWMKWLVPCLLMAAVGVADAKVLGRKHGLHGQGLRGKIVSLAADGSITLRQSRKKGGGEVTVQTNASTAVTIDGVGGKHVGDLRPGEIVLINPVSGVASTIIAKEPKHHRKSKVA